MADKIEKLMELMQKQMVQQQQQLKQQQEQLDRQREEAAAEREAAVEAARLERELLRDVIVGLRSAAPSSIVVSAPASGGSASTSNVQPSSVQIHASTDFQDVAAQIGKFVYSPDDGQTFEPWLKRAAGVFASDKGKSVSDEDKAAIIRSKLSDADYGLFANSILPKEPQQLKFDEMTERLKKLFGRRESLFARRFKAWRVQKTGDEDYIGYAARVNKAAEDFEFASFKIDDFKAQLYIQGLKSPNDVAVLKELMKKTDAHQTKRDAADDPDTVGKLTLDELAVIAERMVTLEKDRKEMEPRTSFKQEVSAVTKDGNIWKCWFCGGSHRHADCAYREKICGDCNSKGHAVGFCASAKSFRDRLRKKQKPSSDKPPTISETKAGTSARKFVKPKVNGVRLEMKHDSGSDWTFISVANWKRIGQPVLQPATSSAVSASGGTVETSGYFSAVIELKEKYGVADVHVSPQGLNLFGNKTMEALELWDTPISAICNSVSESQEQLADEVKLKFPSLFSPKLGRCKLMKASLTFADGAKPQFMRARNVALAARAGVEKALKKLQEQGVIKPVGFAEAAAPIVAVLKKNGDIRIAADYATGLNRALQPFHYPLPTPETIFATLAGMDMFSTIDLSDAFLQVELDDEAKRYMAINTHMGLFQVTRMQPGVKTAPGQFQQLMDSILAGTGASAYLDDVIVAGKGQEDHKKRLFEVLKRIEDAGLTLKHEKCTFGQSSIRFLGKIIDAAGQRPDPEKLKAIREMPTPQDIGQLRSFLGAINWYGSFVPNLKDLRGPLDEMLRKNEKFIWTAERSLAFSKLKKALHSNLALTHYDPTKKLIVAADASSYGVGAALMHQLEDGSIRPVMYAASSLNDAERNYPQVEREALALVFAVKKFRQYVYGRKFELQTDHKPLLRIFGDKSGIPVHTANRLRRYALALLGYDFTIRYVKNADFAYADFVSRVINMHPKPGVEDVVIAEIRGEEYNSNLEDEAVVLSNVTRPLLSEELKQATAECQHLTKVINYVKDSSWPTKKKQITDPEAAEFFAYRGELRTAGECLFLGQVPVIPAKLRERILEELHEGHPGSSRMQALAREQCFWPGINQQIVRFVQRCKNCQLNAKSPRKEVLHPWPEPGAPWERIHIDFADKDGESFLVVVDSYSNWPEVFLMRSTTAEKTVDALKEAFARWGPCQTLVSDNGPQFISSAFRSFVDSLGIQHITSAPYNPQSNGRAEKFVDTLKRGLEKLSDVDNTTEKLRVFLLNYRKTPSYALQGKSPFEKMTGRKMPSRLDLLKRTQPREQQESRRSQQMSQQFNRHHGARPREFEVNEPVFYKLFRANGWRWREGTIVARRGAANYDVLVEGRTIKAHTNQIQRRHENEPFDYDDNYSVLLNPFSQMNDEFDPDESNDEQFQSFNDDSGTEEFQAEVNNPTPIEVHSPATTPLASSDPPPTLHSRPQRSTAGKTPSFLKDYICSVVDQFILSVVADHLNPSEERG